MDLTYIPLFLMAGLLALILVAPLLSEGMPDFPDRRRDRK
jgi:hypothetical protein